MNERIKKLSELTLTGKMYPRGKKVEFDRNDIFLSNSERKAKQIHDYVLAQDSLITEFQTMARPCMLDQQQVEADYLHFGSTQNSRELLRDFYCKPIENLSTFEWQHATPNYAELLRLGIDGMIKNIDAACMSFESDSEKIDFLKALKVVAHTLTEWSQKCSEEALNVALNTDNPEYKENLTRLSGTLKRIPGNPPQTLYEAILYINILFAYELGTLPGLFSILL